MKWEGEGMRSHDLLEGHPHNLKTSTDPTSASFHHFLVCQAWDEAFPTWACGEPRTQHDFNSWQYFMEEPVWGELMLST